MGTKKNRQAKKTPKHVANPLQAAIADILTSFNQGRFEAAATKSRLFIQKFPQNPFGWKVLGTALGAGGKTEDALSALRKAASLTQLDPDIFNSMGNACKALGRNAEARGHYEKALEIAPGYADAHNNLGILVQEAGRLEEALAHYEKALEQRPDLMQAHTNAATVLKRLGRFEAARAHCENVLASHPASATACNTLGAILQEEGDSEQALSWHAKALELEPHSPEIWNDMGVALQELGRYDEAVAAFRNALAMEPTQAASFFNLGNCDMARGRQEAAMEHYLHALHLRPDCTTFFDIFYIVLNSVATDQEHIYTACRHHAALYENVQAFTHSAVAAATDKPVLRIGYVSGDFNTSHPLYYFLHGVLEHHDASQFAIHCYATSPKEDAFTDRIRNSPAHWTSLVGHDDAAAAQRIHDDAIDILIDLSGHTHNNRLGVFARKPAPVQATWLGFLNTTGLQAMDYLLCNKWLVRPEEAAFCSETPWYLEGPGSCFRNDALERDLPIAPLPALANGVVTFGCCNTFHKINADVLACWIEILQNTPGSRLLCKAKLFARETVRAEFLEHFQRAGIAASRILLEGPSPFLDFLDTFNRIDISLDTFPYNGGTITCHSLSMGVPVLTLTGQSVISHAGESFLRPLGLDAWVAEDRADYVAMATDWAGRLEELAALRQELRGRLSRVHGDAAAFTRRLESAYRGMWQAFCAGGSASQP